MRALQRALWRAAVVVALLAATAAAACLRSSEQARRREAGYQAQLAAYSAALKLGMTRKEVEDWLEGCL